MSANEKNPTDGSAVWLAMGPAVGIPLGVAMGSVGAGVAIGAGVGVVLYLTANRRAKGATGEKDGRGPDAM